MPSVCVMCGIFFVFLFNINAVGTLERMVPEQLPNIGRNLKHPATASIVIMFDPAPRCT